MSNLAQAIQNRGNGNSEELHKYWVLGAGREKWVHDPHPWTALKRHLAKFIHDPALLNATVSRWHNEVMLPTGSDVYRMQHGGKIRGNKIGKG